MLSSASSVSARRVVLRGLAGGLSVAALVGVVAVLSHSFDRTDARLIGTSLGFSVFSALSGAGAAARRRDGLVSLGAATIAGAVASFGLLMVAIWVDRASAAWRVFGLLAVLTLACSHACLVLGARRGSDRTLVANLTVTSVLTASVDAVLAALGIAGHFDHVSAGEIRFIAIVNIAMLLSTALPPILRRAANQRDAAGIQGTLPDDGPGGELLTIARRLEQLVPDAGSLAHQIEREAIRLRELAETEPLR